MFKHSLAHNSWSESCEQFCCLPISQWTMAFCSPVQTWFSPLYWPVYLPMSHLSAHAEPILQGHGRKWPIAMLEISQHHMKSLGGKGLTKYEHLCNKLIPREMCHPYCQFQSHPNVVHSMIFMETVLCKHRTYAKYLRRFYFRETPPRGSSSTARCSWNEWQQKLTVWNHFKLSKNIYPHPFNLRHKHDLLLLIDWLFSYLPNTSLLDRFSVCCHGYLVVELRQRETFPLPKSTLMQPGMINIWEYFKSAH